MKKVYDNLQPISLVGHFKSILDQAGIAAVVKNENSQLIIGEIPHTEISPELWVIHDEDYDKAMAILTEYRKQSTDETGSSWQCPQCSEELEASFGQCWKCDTMRPTEAADG